MSRLQLVSRSFALSTKVGNWFQPLAGLAARIWIAKVFFESGLTKIQSFANTKMLFKYEYNVALLPPEWAAAIGTGTELVIPPLLLLGLGARIPAIILFAFNAVAAFSYPFLWTEAGTQGLYQHIVWGIILLYLCSYGPGKLSADFFLTKKET